MKKILCSLLCLVGLACFGQTILTADGLASFVPKTASVSCTVNTGNLLNESFEGSIPAGWTLNGSITTWGNALPGTSPCSGLGTKSLGVVSTGGSLGSYYFDFGSALGTTTDYMRCYLYVDSQSFVNGNIVLIANGGAVAHSASSSQWGLYVEFTTGGGLHIFGNSANIPISVATWYRVEVKSVKGGTGEIKVFAADGSSVGDVTYTDGASDWQFTNFGAIDNNSANAITVHIDGVGVSSTGFLGQ